MSFDAHSMLDDAAIGGVVDTFYERVRADVQLGPIFNGAITAWPEHLQKLAAFWSSVMLASGRYKGNPVLAHMRQLPSITPEMFERWLALWSEVTAELVPAIAAKAMQDKAAMIAESLKLALFFRLAPAMQAVPHASATGFVRSVPT